jgi:hypothetical protein
LISFCRKDEVCQANHFLGPFTLENDGLSEEIKTKVNAIKQQYFITDGEMPNEKYFQSLSDAFTDSGFHYGTSQMAK